MGRVARILVALVVIIPIGLILFFAIQAPGSFVKNYHFPLVEIEATVRPDGALVIDEHRTFAFEGEFTYAFFTVKWPLPQIQEFSISESGQPVNTALYQDGANARADWTFSAHDERRTFDIHYVALCAVDVYPDTAHLNWQFVGTGWDKPTDLVRIRVHLPEVANKEARLDTCPAPPAEGLGPGKGVRPLRRDEIKAWGHGPLAGEVFLPDPQTVELVVPDLQPLTFVEGSIVFPKGVVPFAPEQSGKSYASIVGEERRLAEEANALRRRHDLEMLVPWILAVLLPLFMIAMVIVARRRDQVPGVPSHLTEAPEEIHPVELAVLWSTTRGSLDAKTAYRAQLLHLMRNGTIEALPVGRVSDPDDFQLRLVKTPGDMDREFCTFLFAETGPAPILLKTVRDRGSRRERLTAWWSRVGAKTKGSVEKVVKGRTRAETSAAFFVALLVALYGYWRGVGFVEGSPNFFNGFLGPRTALLVPEAVVVYLIGRRFIPSRLPDRLRERMAKWRAFRRFLTDFSTFEDAPALAVTIWERYLVYAVALGVADEVEKQVRGLVPEDQLPEPWPGAPTGREGFIAYNRSVGSTSAHVASNAASAVGWSSGWGSSSSGGGGGGGFSGGGGGGGGGTGGGAG